MRGIKITTAILVIGALLLGLLICAAPRSQAAPLKGDKIVVLKGERRLLLLKDGEVLKNYRICLGFNPTGHKTRRGDGKTPEGKYTIDWRNPNSKFHLSLHVSYPNAADKARARKQGVDPGGNIMIHGRPNGHGAGWVKRNASRDWTAGCIAVSDAEIEALWRLVPNGTPIEIRK